MCTGSESPIGLDRRGFLQRFGGGLGGIALANVLHAETGTGLHHAAKAKRVIFLFQSGAPSQIDLFDHKPRLIAETGKELPDSVRQGQRLTGMSGNQASLPLVGCPFKFAQHGKSGHWISDRLPETAKIADDLCIVKSMYTEAINHGPGVTFMQTGSQFPGRPSMGAWLSHGLGTMNQNLPDFVTLVTKGKGGQPLVSRLWGSGFLPGKHAGTRFRPDKDAILYLNSPKGVTPEGRRKMLDRLKDLHELQLERTGDPRIETRIAQYEMGFRMQASIPKVTDLSKEPDSTFKLYGEDARKPGTFAANCLLARRLAEQDVRFIQLYHPGWDQHGGLPGGISRQCKETDRASAALVKDLKARGMLEDTLVIWGGEFGRTNYCQGKFNAKNFGRDHHPRCFSIWMAGGGTKAGSSYGRTDEYSYNIAENGVHVHDFHATILHLLGIDHERLTYKYQGRHFRLTDVHGHVVKPILA
ncbi:MAG: sulfatase [Opitutae bacterium]|nr:sulfatase [Opitutae bacterium]